MTRSATKLSKKEVDEAGGWKYATKEAEEQGKIAQKRGDFLKGLSSKARRMAGSLYDADQSVRDEVFKAFGK